MTECVPYLLNDCGVHRIPPHVQLQQSIEAAKSIGLSIAGGVQHTQLERSQAIALNEGVGEGRIGEEGLQAEDGVLAGGLVVGLEACDEGGYVGRVVHGEREAERGCLEDGPEEGGTEAGSDFELALLAQDLGDLADKDEEDEREHEAHMSKHGWLVRGLVGSAGEECSDGACVLQG